MSDVKRYEIERYNPDTVMYQTCDGEWERHADAQAARDADAAEIARLREALAQAEQERDAIRTELVEVLRESVVPYTTHGGDILVVQTISGKVNRLIALGKVDIISDDGRRVIARWR